MKTLLVSLLLPFTVNAAPLWPGAFCNAMNAHNCDFAAGVSCVIRSRSSHFQDDALALCMSMTESGEETCNLGYKCFANIADQTYTQAELNTCANMPTVSEKTACLAKAH